MAAPDLATVVAAHGRRALLSAAGDGERRPGLLRGRALEVCVGDVVRTAPADAGQLVVEAVEPRRTLVLRSVDHRRKLLAANVDQALILIGPSPRFAEDILLRVMIAVRAAGVDTLIVANKTDHARFAELAPRLAALRALGEHVIETSVTADPGLARERLSSALAGRSTVLLGESGMGKSSLLNLLVPGAAQRVNDISAALGAGRHTTTSSCMFRLDIRATGATTVIDTPGFQQFGLAHLSPTERDHAFVDIAPYLGACRFHNCRHDREPGCRLREAAERGEIDPLRFRLYTAIRDQAA